jgi:TetR/AcrR family transcriptional regulator
MLRHSISTNPPTKPAAQASEPPATDPSGGAGVALPLSVGKRERNAAATRQRILDAGEHEFAARGFAGARLREIAEAAGVQPALIHHYFTDKHGLSRAVLDRALLPSSMESWTLLSGEPDLPRLVAGFIELLLRFYAAHHNLLAILRHEAVSGSTVLEELARERTLPIIEAVTRFLEDRQRAGEVRDDVPPAEIIAAGMGMVVYPFVEEGLIRVMLPSVAARDEASLARRKDAIVALLLAGIRPRAEQAGAEPPPQKPKTGKRRGA